MCQREVLLVYLLPLFISSKTLKKNAHLGYRKKGGQADFPLIARFGAKPNSKRGNSAGRKERNGGKSYGREEQVDLMVRLNCISNKIVSFIPLMNLSRSHLGAAFVFLISMKSTLIFLANQMCKFEYLRLHTTYFLSLSPVSIRLQSPAHFMFTMYLCYVSIYTSSPGLYLPGHLSRFVCFCLSAS